jgi:hypothetical protein
MQKARVKDFAKRPPKKVMFDDKMTSVDARPAVTPAPSKVNHLTRSFSD